MTAKIIYSLDCDHAAPYASTFVSGKIYCIWCDEPRPITGVIEYEWKATCLSCIYSRWAGLSKHNAGIFLAGHLSRNPDHKGIREYARNPEATKTAAKIRAFNGC